MSHTFILRELPHPVRAGAKQAIDDAPDGSLITIDPLPKKSRLQEEKYHAIFNDVAKQCQHLNLKFSPEGWKRLLIDQFRSDMLNDPTCDEDIKCQLKDAVRMVPSLDGSAIVSIGIQSRNFKTKTAAAFIDWLCAFAADRGVVLRTSSKD